MKRLLAREGLAPSSIRCKSNRYSEHHNYEYCAVRCKGCLRCSETFRVAAVETWKIDVVRSTVEHVQQLVDGALRQEDMDPASVGPVGRP